jgi:uncharacterized membrane protein
MTARAAEEPPLLELVLTPHRSLPRRGFMALMALLMFVMFVVLAAVAGCVVHLVVVVAGVLGSASALAQVVLLAASWWAASSASSRSTKAGTASKAPRCQRGDQMLQPGATAAARSASGSR